MTRSFFYCKISPYGRTLEVLTHAFFKLQSDIPGISSFGIGTCLLRFLEPDMMIGIRLFFDVEIIEDSRENDEG